MEEFKSPLHLLREGRAAQIGPAFATLVWMLSSAPVEADGWVRAGDVVTREEVADDLGCTIRTVSRHLTSLVNGGFLEVWEDARGFTARLTAGTRLSPLPGSVIQPGLPGHESTCKDKGEPGQRSPARRKRRQVAGDEGKLLREFDRCHRAWTLLSGHEVGYRMTVYDRREATKMLEVHKLASLQLLVEPFFRDLEKAIGTPSEKYWRPTLTNFLGKVPRLLMVRGTLKPTGKPAPLSKQAQHYEMRQQTHVEGVVHYNQGGDMKDNPYPEKSLRWVCWKRGWQQGCRTHGNDPGKFEPYPDDDKED